jgi:hypothetical protein
MSFAQPPVPITSNSSKIDVNLTLIISFTD